MIKPIPHRNLKAQMVLKGISLAQVSQRAGVPYNTCSQILNGRQVHPEYLRRIRKAIESAPVLSLA